MRRCIYCLAEKDEVDFDREHVIPRAFGTFDTDTMVLTCVCKKCNGEFGTTIDEKLARDTLEGLDRVQAGLKKAAEFKTLGHRSTTHVQLDKDGPMQGALAHHVPDPSGNGLAVALLPQVGFSPVGANKFDWFLLRELPTRDDLVVRGYERGTELLIKTWGAPIETCVTALEARGFAGFKVEAQMQPPSGPAKSETVAHMGDPDFRALAKIAFNYLTATTSPQFVLQPQFNDIRRYIHAGVRTQWKVVEPCVLPWEICRGGQLAVGHYITVSGSQDKVRAELSLLLRRIRYRFLLADGGFLLPFKVQRGHFFDVNERKVESMPEAVVQQVWQT